MFNLVEGARVVTKKGLNGEVKPRGIRQTMSDLHIWTGLLVGWLLYAMFLTGTVSYFKDEISQWMRPEIPQQEKVPDIAELSARIAQELHILAPGSSQWSINLPDARNNTANAFWRKAASDGKRGFDSAIFDAASGKKVVARSTRGGEFFYRFHFQFHFMPVMWGRWLAGFCAMFMLVAIVSGVITHKKIFTDFFTFRWGKGQRSWLDAHGALSVFGLPFHAMITYTGLVTLMTMYMPWGEQFAFKTAAERQQMRTETTVFAQAEKPSGQRAQPAPLEDMVRQAQLRWGREGVGRVIISNPNDSKAKVTIARSEHGRVSHSPQFMLFDGVSGQLLNAKENVGAAAETRGVLYALHLGRFGDDVTRWLYFLVSLAGTAMVGTGLVLWTVKRRAKLPDPLHPYLGFKLVERLNISAIAGLSIAVATMLWANRLLPIELAQRADWEVHAFFVAWGAALTWALVRPAKQAWVELLCVAAAALALLPLVNALTTERGLFVSLYINDWVFSGMDLALLVLGAFHAAVAIRVAQHRPLAARQKPKLERSRPIPLRALGESAEVSTAQEAV